MSAKRKALLAEKERILDEIKYYEKRIEEARAYTKKSSFCEDDDSSDETDLVLLDTSPSLRELKQQQEMLKTCLHATQELTSLEVLQSEVNVLVDSPSLDGSSPVKEDGIWREVVAECCLDLVPFAITFYAFKANRNFAPIEYKNLKVTAIKKAHDVELSKSVLPGLTRPSDAIEVIRSYAFAQRSRRTTLARLANKFNDSLILEPLPEGGYLMKCANLLEVSWTLQNKWSPIAPFHHRMKFDLEYMDETYIKTITQAHRQLSEPDVDTDERTLLLAKIITTCLQAQGPTQELHDSMSSDPAAARALHTRRTNLDREPDEPSVKRLKKDKDGDIMAPPKAVPKKARKDKANGDSNKKTTKRPIEHNEDENSSKKAKALESTKDKEINNKRTTLNHEHSVATSKNKEAIEKRSDINKSDSIKKKSTENIVTDKEVAKKVSEQHTIEDKNTKTTSLDKRVKKTVQNSAKTFTKVGKVSDKIDKPKDCIEKSNEEISKPNEKSLKSSDTTKVLKTNSAKTITKEKSSNKPQNGENVSKDKDVKKGATKTVSKVSENIKKDDNTTKSNVKASKDTAGDKTSKDNVKSNTNNYEPTVTKANKNSKNGVAGNTVGKNTQKIVSNEKIVKKPITDNHNNLKESGNNAKKVKNVTSSMNTNTEVSEKANEATKTIPSKPSVAIANKNANVASAEKNLNKNPVQTKVPKVIRADKPKNSVPKIGIIPNKPKATVTGKKNIASNTRTLNGGNLGKENTQTGVKVSKIPLKKLSSESASKLILRVSPRQPLKPKVPSKFGPETKLKSK